MSKPQFKVPDVKRINSELFTLTYGSLVAQLIKDFEDDDEVNKQLEKMGFNIGVRLIEEFLARANVSKCQDFKETAEIISKVGFKMFLGISPTVANWDQEGREFSLLFDDNPLTEFVELPEAHKQLRYSNILCGVLRGALQMIHMKVETEFVKDVLRGDDATEMRVKLIEILQDMAPPGED